MALPRFKRFSTSQRGRRAVLLFLNMRRGIPDFAAFFSVILYFRTLHHFSPTAHHHAVASFPAIIYFQESVLSQLNQQSKKEIKNELNYNIVHFIVKISLKRCYVYLFRCLFQLF